MIMQGWRLAAMLAAGAAMFGSPYSAKASDIQSFTTQFNTDWTWAGTGGMRNGDGTGSIGLSGVSGSVTKAYLYWHGPSNVNDPNANANVTFNGNGITGTSLGLSNDNCWGFANSLAYRSDVTSLVSGNGTYSLANFIKPNVQINGVSLVVFFDDGNGTNNRDVVLFDGNDSNIPNSFDANGWNISLSGINYASGNANIVFGVSDGQTFSDGSFLVNGNTIASGNVFQGDSVPNGPTAGQTNGGLWDIKSFDITSLLSPGPNTLTITHQSQSDCLSCIHVAIDLPAGAAPPIQQIPEPPSLLLLLAGLGALWQAQRRGWI